MFANDPSRNIGKEFVSWKNKLSTIATLRVLIDHTTTLIG